MQQGDFAGASEPIHKYVNSGEEGQYKQRLMAAVDLLVRFSRFSDAAALLTAAVQKSPADFELVSALTNVGSKLPEVGNPVPIWTRYLDATAYAEAS